MGLGLGLGLGLLGLDGRGGDHAAVRVARDGAGDPVVCEAHEVERRRQRRLGVLVRVRVRARARARARARVGVRVGVRVRVRRRLGVLVLGDERRPLELPADLVMVRVIA